MAKKAYIGVNTEAYGCPYCGGDNVVPASRQFHCNDCGEDILESEVVYETKSVARKIKKGYVGVETFTKRNLPSGYTQVEYIRSSGTQYIDTGFVPNQDTRVVCRTLLPLNSKTNWLFGSRNSADERKYAFAASSANYYSAHYNTVNPRFDKTLTPGGVFTVDFNKQNICIIADGVTYTTTSTPTYAAFDTPSSMLLFACVTGGSVACGSSAIYACQIYDNGALVRDFVPCTNASGIAGMYDMAGGSFYTNAGSGTFAAGTSAPSVARKIKKAYIGIGGVARPCWSGGELAYYGTVTELDTTRPPRGASVGNYAVFGGHRCGTGHCDDVTAYSSSLTRSILDPLNKSTSDMAAASVGDYALFAGGSSSGSKQTTVYAYNSSLTKSTPTALSAKRYTLAGTSINGYAVFGGGYGSDPSNVVDAYNTSLTRTIPKALGRASMSPSAASVGGSYAIFMGGHDGTSSTFYSTVTVYDTSLSKVSTSGLGYTASNQEGVSGERYALFAGGTNSSGQLATVRAIDESLTKQTTPNLSAARTYISGVRIGEFALLAGGYVSDSGTKVIDTIDDSLTMTSNFTLSTGRGCSGTATVGNYALIAGGSTRTSSNVSVVDAFTIV